MTKLETPQKENKRIYYFSTHSYQVAFEVLNIEPHQVYKTDEKGLFYLLKSMVGCGVDDFIDHDVCIDCQDIPIILDTNLEKVIEETREMSGYDCPEEFNPPKTEPDERAKIKTKIAEELKPLITEESLAKSKHNNSYEEGKK
jgi:hypothetical protein